MEKDIYILAIESSCDETAAAVVKMAVKYCLMLFHLRLNCINCMVVLYLKLPPGSMWKKSIR